MTFKGLKHTAETKLKMRLSTIGQKHSKATKLKMRLSSLAEKNPMWKGDKVGFRALHAWVTRELPKPQTCELCHRRPPLDLSNISGKYKRELSDWQWLCRRCHMQLDGRLVKFMNLNPFIKGHKNYLGRTRDEKGRFVH